MPIFTEPFHNEDGFDVHFLKDEKRAKRCAACFVEFPKSVTIQPFDLVMQHPERYMYPQKKDGDIKWIYTAERKELLFIIVSQSVFLRGIHISQLIKSKSLRKLGTI